MNNPVDKPWGGRFVAANDELMERFNASIGFDRRLLKADIEGSTAYAYGLKRIGILSEEELSLIHI